MHDFLKALLIVLALLYSVSSNAQEVQNMRVNVGALEDGVRKYFFTYDLMAPHANIPYNVKVKFTAGTSTMYLKLVTGDVGNLVFPGKDKKFVWDYQEELIHFSNDAPKIEIEAFPNVKVESKVKRSKNLSVKMDSIYTKDKHYTFILYRKEKEVARLLDMPLNRNSFSIEIPRKTKVRKDYQLSITDGQQAFFSNSFKVKPKVGTFWKVIPFLLVPAYVLFSQYQEENKELPGVPEIPAN